MKFLFRLLSIMGLSAIFQLYFPFWIIGVIAFLVGIAFAQRQRRWAFSKRKKQQSFSFWAGFLAIFILWGLIAWIFDMKNDSILSTRMAGMLFSGLSDTLSASIKPFVLICLTSMIGGLLAGFSSMAGNALGEIIRS
ncbi:MAG: hypothetical protein AAF694_03025 [Bacteroidota bacterium]